MKYVSNKVFASLFGLLFSGSAIAADLSLELESARTHNLIKSVKFLGSGCPAASDVSYTKQGNYLFFRFPAELKAAVGPGISLASVRKNCSATIELDNKAQVAVESFGWFATADLDNQQEASLNVSWFYQGDSKTGSFSAAHKGSGKTWFNNFTGKAGEDLWSSCNENRALTINTSLRIAGPREEEANAQIMVLGVRLKSRGC